MSTNDSRLYSTVPLPDGIVIGGHWPDTIVAWPGGKARGATKPEYDLFQKLEQLREENQQLTARVEMMREVLESGCEIIFEGSHSKAINLEEIEQALSNLPPSQEENK